MKIIFMLLAGFFVPVEALAESSCKVNVRGEISKQIWYDALQGCKKVTSTKELILLLKIDAVDLGYTNCIVHETEYPKGHGLHRNCDQIEGYAIFGSSKKYCRWLQRPFKGKK